MTVSSLDLEILSLLDPDNGAQKRRPTPDFESESGPGAQDDLGTANPGGSADAEDVPPSSPLTPPPSIHPDNAFEQAPTNDPPHTPPTTGSATIVAQKRGSDHLDQDDTSSDPVPPQRVSERLQKKQKIQTFGEIDAETEPVFPDLFEDSPPRVSRRSGTRKKAASKETPIPNPPKPRDDLISLFSNLRLSDEQDWEKLMKYERDASGLNSFTFRKRCQPHKFMVEAVWKSKVYMRLPVWYTRSALDPTASVNDNDTLIESVYQIFEMPCDPTDTTWLACKTVLRLAMELAEALSIQDPQHEVGSFEADAHDRVFGPIGSVRVFSSATMDAANPHAIRNLFGTHHLLVVPKRPPVEPSFDREGLEEVYLRNADTVCDVHCTSFCLPSPIFIP